MTDIDDEARANTLRNFATCHRQLWDFKPTYHWAYQEAFGAERVRVGRHWPGLCVIDDEGDLDHKVLLNNGVRER